MQNKEIYVVKKHVLVSNEKKKKIVNQQEGRSHSEDFLSAVPIGVASCSVFQGEPVFRFLIWVEMV